MKPEDYFKIMDCVSEKDITEMMQTRRFRQIPSGEEDIMKQSDRQEQKAFGINQSFRKDLSGEDNPLNESEHPEKKDFRLTRRGLASGTAVAAALLALNVGFGSFLLHDSVGTTSSTEIDVTEDVTETTISAPETAETVTTAAKQKDSVKQTTAKASEKTAKTTATQNAKKTTESQTTATSAHRTASQPSSASAQTPAAAQTQQSTVSRTQQQQPTAQRTPAGPPAPQTNASRSQSDTPQSGRLTYSLLPADRNYESGTNADAPIVFHAAAGEQIRMQLTVQNDPGVACFGVRYNMESFSLLSQSNLQYYNGDVNSYVLSGENYQILSVGGTGDGRTKAPDGAALAEFTLIAPTRPGRYVIEEYNPDIYSFEVNPDGTETRITDFHNAYADDDQTVPVACSILGAEIIVEEAENTSAYQIDLDTLQGPTVYMEPVTAHAGQKNVPVNVYISGCDPFAAGYLRFGFDPALQSLLYDSEKVYETDVTSDSRLGIRVDGTLLEHAMLLKSSVSFGNVINIFFNNYRSFGYDENGEPTVFHNGATQTDAAITENGLLFTMYFDMPEECGHYQIIANDGNFSGGAQEEPDCLPNQAFRNFIPCDITVIP